MQCDPSKMTGIRKQEASNCFPVNSPERDILSEQVMTQMIQNYFNLRTVPLFFSYILYCQREIGG